MPEATTDQTQAPPAQQQAPPAQQQAPAQTAQQPTEQGDIVGQALDNLGGFFSPEDRQALIDLYENRPVDKKDDKPTEAPVNNPVDKKDDPAPDKNGEEADKKEPLAAPSADDEKKGLFGINKKKADNKSDLVIEKPEQILEVIKAKYGQDIKEIKELPKFFESVDKMRADAQKLKPLEEKHAALWNELESLPPELIESIQKFGRGEDYKSAFSSKTVADLSKPFDKQDSKALINHYFPGKFTEDDFKEKPEERSETLKIAEDAAKIKFEAEKQTYDSRRATVSENAKRTIESQKAAAGSSVSNLKQRFPDIDDDAFNQVKSVVDGGAQKVLSFFFNNDGTIKPDAATRLMAAMNYDELINEASGLAAHVAETKINEDLLTRGADAPAPAKPSGTPEQIDPVIKKKIDEMTRLGELSSKRTF